MTKEEVLTELKKAREGYVPGSATRVAYNNAIDLVESIHDKPQTIKPASDEPKPKRKYTKRQPKPEIGRNAKPKGKKKDILDTRYTRIVYTQGMPLEIANPLQIKDVPLIIVNEDDDDRIVYKCPTIKETKEWVRTTKYGMYRGSLTSVLDMMEAGVEPPVKRKYVRKAK